MRVDKFLLCIFTVATLMTACKKDDDDPDDRSYLSGTIAFVEDIPEYVEYGFEMDVHVTGVRHPKASRKSDGTYTDTLGYYFINPFTSVSDTVKRFGDPVDVKVVYHLNVTKDSLARYNLTATAFAPEYYPSSCSSPLNVVRPGYGDDKSIRGFMTDTPSETLGGKSYYVTKVAGLEWIRQNYSGSEAGLSYKGCGVMDDIFGRYYTWNEAQSVCPQGWRLPTSAELDSLVAAFGGVGALMADVYFNGSRPADKMWTYWPEVGSVSDESRFSVIPTGYALLDEGKSSFYDLKSRAVLWTSDAESGKGVARYIYEDQNVLFRGSFDKDYFAASVRCVTELQK